MQEDTRSLHWTKQNVPTVHVPGEDNWAADFLSQEKIGPGVVAPAKGFPSNLPEVEHAGCGPYCIMSEPQRVSLHGQSSTPWALAVDDLIISWEQFSTITSSRPSHF